MSGDDAPEPFVPIDTDVTDLDGFMLNVERLLASELLAVATVEECWAALMLWCRAWKQIPGGSLPNDERILASFSGSGKRWPKVRQNALHGFVLCSDGRLYHRFLCVEVMRAVAKKNAYLERRERDSERLRKWREQHQRNAGETRFVAEDTVRDGTVVTTEADASVAGGRAPEAPNGNAGNGGSQRRTRITSDWQPDFEDCQYASGRGHDQRWIAEQAELFRDRNLRDGSVYANWRAAWRTWVQRADEFAGRNSVSRPRQGGRGPSGVLAALGDLGLSGEMD